VACNVFAAGLAVLWLKPLITRLVKQQIASHAEAVTLEPAPVKQATAS